MADEQHTPFARWRCVPQETQVDEEACRAPRQTAWACLASQSLISELGLGVRDGDADMGAFAGVPGPEAAVEGAEARAGRALSARERMSASMSRSVIWSARRSGSPNTCQGKARSHGA